MGHTWSKARWCLPIFAAPAASVVVRTRFVQSRLSRGRRSARVRHRKNRQPLSRLAPGAPGLGEPARAARQGRRGAGDEIVRPSPPREAAVTRFPVLTLRTRPPAAGYRLGAHPGVPADSPDHMGHASQLIPQSSTPDFGLCAGWPKPTEAASARRALRNLPPPPDTLGGPVRRRAKPGVARGKPQRWRASPRHAIPSSSQGEFTPGCRQYA